MMMLFPPWFKNTYEKTWQTLKMNQARLTNNYDVHLTMRDILDENFMESGNPKASSGYGQSLFTEISSNRTCEAAGIPQHYCACQSSREVSVTDNEVVKVAQLFIDYINNLLTNNPECAQLNLHQVSIY